MRQLVEQLEAEKRDLEMALTTACEHGDAVEVHLDEINQRLHLEVEERRRAESRLETVLDAVSQQKQDLELLVHTITEHSDELDVEWLQRYRTIERLSRIDGLTQIANRHAFDATLVQHWKRLLRSGGTLALAMCDVDLFKQFNDLYGHQAGDDCLVRVARVLAGNCRRTDDMAARYGGEEFALVLPETQLEGALDLAEAVRADIAALAIPHAGSPHGRVTISVGVAVTRPSQENGPWEVVAEADRCLYQAKRDGRDVVRS